MATGCLLHLLLIPLAFVAAFIGMLFDKREGALTGLMIGYWGPLAQLLYLAPAAMRYHRRGEREGVKGIVIVGVVTALACVPCWLIALQAVIRHV